MDGLTNNQGLQHISEKIFKILKFNDLVKCRRINTSWKRIVDQPSFLIKSIQLLARPNQPNILKNQEYWKEIVTCLKNVQYSENEVDELIHNQLVHKTIMYLWKTLEFMARFKNLIEEEKDIPSPLNIATKCEDLDFVKFLLKIQPHLANIYFEGFQPIHICVQRNNLQMLKLFADTIGNPNSFHIWIGGFKSTLQYAIQQNCHEIAEYLIQFKFSHDLRNEIYSVSQKIAFEDKQHKKECLHLKMLQILTATKKYDALWCGWILNQAVRKGRIEVVKLLLQNVDDPLNPNYFSGSNPIDLCLLHKPKGYEEMVTFFKNYQ